MLPSYVARIGIVEVFNQTEAENTICSNSTINGKVMLYKYCDIGLRIVSSLVDRTLGLGYNAKRHDIELTIQLFHHTTPAAYQHTIHFFCMKVVTLRST